MYTKGDKIDLESIGLDMKRIANDLSEKYGCSIDEESVKLILNKNFSHTGKIIDVNASVNDCTAFTMTSAITMETSMVAVSNGAGKTPPGSNSNNQIGTASREINGIDAFDPSDPESPTTKAFYHKNPHLDSSEVANSVVITARQSNVPIPQHSIEQQPPTAFPSVEKIGKGLVELANNHGEDHQHSLTSTNIAKSNETTMVDDQSKASTAETRKV